MTNAEDAALMHYELGTIEGTTPMNDPHTFWIASCNTCGAYIDDTNLHYNWHQTVAPKSPESP